MLTSFVITGTPADLLVEPVARPLIWAEIDLSVASTLHSPLNGGTFPATASARCTNWVDLAAPPPPGG